MVTAGIASTGADPVVRAAFLLVNVLAVLALRARLAELLDVDPLSAEGARRWRAQVFAIYREGLTGEPLAIQRIRRHIYPPQVHLHYWSLVSVFRYYHAH